MTPEERATIERAIERLRERARDCESSGAACRREVDMGESAAFQEGRAVAFREAAAALPTLLDTPPDPDPVEWFLGLTVSRPDPPPTTRRAEDELRGYINGFREAQAQLRAAIENPERKINA